MTKTPQRKIADAYRVPTWIAGIEPKPAWWRHPFQRIQGWRWNRIGDQ